MNTQEVALVSCLTYLFQLTSHLFVCSLNFKAPNLHLHSIPWVYRNPISFLTTSSGLVNQTWMSTLGTPCHLTSILRLKMTTGQLSTVNILSICQSTFCNSENLIKKLSESSPKPWPHSDLLRSSQQGDSEVKNGHLAQGKDVNVQKSEKTNKKPCKSYKQ